MKPFLILLLGASLIANLLLFKNRPASISDAPSAASAPSKKPGDTAPALSAEVWSLVASGDPASVEKLRALGLPESLINTLIRHQTDLRYRERGNSLLTASASQPYWSAKFDRIRYGSYYSPEFIDLRRQKQAELKALLGPDYRKDDLIQDPRTAFLPPAKAEQLREIEEDYSAMMQSFAANDWVTLPEDREKRAFLEKQKRADLAELLTPEELTAYELRSSPTAGNLRRELATIDLTEDEFKTLYALRKPYDERPRTEGGTAIVIGAGSYSFTAPLNSQERDALNAEIKAALGDERYAEYERAQDSDYRTLTQLATRLELPPAKALEAHALKVALEKKLTAFKPTPGADIRQQRTDHLAALAREAETGFTAILGEKGYAVYKDNSAFFRRLQPPAPPPR
jgi:hypothetical protein